MSKLRTLVSVECQQKGQIEPYNGIVVGSIGEPTITSDKGLKVDVRYYKDDVTIDLENGEKFTKGGDYLMRKEILLSETQLNDASNGLDWSIFSYGIEVLLVKIHLAEMYNIFGISIEDIEEIIVE